VVAEFDMDWIGLGQQKWTHVQLCAVEWCLLLPVVVVPSPRCCLGDLCESRDACALNPCSSGDCTSLVDGGYVCAPLVNECVTEANVCHNGGTCIDTPDSYRSANAVAVTKCGSASYA